MNRPVEICLPKVAKPFQLRKFGEHVVILPDERLEDGRMVWHPVEDFSGREGVTLEHPPEVALALHRITSVIAITLSNARIL